MHSLYVDELQWEHDIIWPEIAEFINRHGIHNFLPFHILAGMYGTGENHECLDQHMQTIQSIFECYPEEDILQCLMHTKSIPCLVANFPVEICVATKENPMEEQSITLPEQPIELPGPNDEQPEKPKQQQQVQCPKRRLGKKERKKKAKLEASQQGL